MQSLGDTLGQVFRAIWASKLRSFLTMFGIAWGVGSMLLLIGMGEGFRSGQRRQLSKLGNDLIMDWGGTIPALPNQHSGMRPYKLTLRDEAEMRKSPEIRNATAILIRSDLKQVSQFASAGGQVMGVEPNFSEIRFVPIKDGRFLNHGPISTIVAESQSLDTRAPNSSFPAAPPVGEFFTLNGARFLVVGVVQNISRGNNDFDNQKVYVPLTTMLEMFPLKGENLPADAVNSIQFQPRTRGENAAAVAAAHQIIGKNHGFDPNLIEAFDEWDTIKEERIIGKIFDAMDVFLGGVGVVTLALGAVGIINIMLVSVSERTREIGLRKAIGATNTSILAQFFLEGIFLTGVSGLVGIVGAAVLMTLLQKTVGEGFQGFDPPRLVPWSAALAYGLARTQRHHRRALSRAQGGNA